jgi:hypothetical protein
MMAQKENLSADAGNCKLPDRLDRKTMKTIDTDPRPNPFSRDLNGLFLVDGGASFNQPDMHDLCGAPWTREVSRDKKSKEDEGFLEWRYLVATLLLSPSPDTNGFYERRPYPLFWNTKHLVQGILREQIEGRRAGDGRPAPDDREDLARWFGVALAFDHNHELARLKPVATKNGTKVLFDVLNNLMKECASVAWNYYSMPDWAEFDLGDIPDLITPGEMQLYRPWTDVQKDMVVLLTAFAQNTEISHFSDQDTRKAFEGSLALRLLAVVRPEIISDELVEGLSWFEHNIQFDHFGSKSITPLVRRINMEQDRLMLERVTDPPHMGKQMDDDAQEEHGAGLNSDTRKRKRLL